MQKVYCKLHFNILIVALTTGCYKIIYFATIIFEARYIERVAHFSLIEVGLMGKMLISMQIVIKLRILLKFLAEKSQFLISFGRMRYFLS